MSDEQPKNLEETLRALADGVRGSIDRLSDVEPDELARAAGIDPDQAREWIGSAGQWLRIQVERIDLGDLADLGDLGNLGDFGQAKPDPAPAAAGSADPWTEAAPHPRDLPTADQGLALAALDSGRWALEPGTSALVAHGDGPGPEDALGLVRQLRVRDWVGIDGGLTLTGHHALERWLRAGD